MGYGSSYFTTGECHGKERDMGRHTKTLHIVAGLLDIPMIQKDMVNAVAYSAATETECSYCK